MVYEFHPLLKYSALIGLAPFAQHSTRRQRCQQIYTFALIVVNVLIGAYTVIFRFYREPVVSYVLSVLLVVNETTSTLIVLAEAMLTYKQYFQYMNHASFIDNYFLKELGQQVCWLTFKRRNERRYVCFAGILYGSFLVTAILHTIYDTNDYVLMVIMSALVDRTRFLQILLMVDCIAFYMEMLNAKLSSPNLVDMSHAPLSSYACLAKLKKLYMELRCLVTLFEDLCGWSIYFLAIGCFADFIVFGYWMLMILSTEYGLKYLISNAIFMFTYIFIMSVLCYTCENIKRQFHMIRALVQRLLKRTCGDPDNELYNDLVNEFSLQTMIHPIEICVKGFFIADLNFLMKVLTAVVTYMVILWQFRVSERIWEQNEQKINHTDREFIEEYVV